MDISLASTLLLLHIAAALWFIAGLIGRAVALGRARSSDDLTEVDHLLPTRPASSAW